MCFEQNKKRNHLLCKDIYVCNKSYKSLFGFLFEIILLAALPTHTHQSKMKIILYLPPQPTPIQMKIILYSPKQKLAALPTHTPIQKNVTVIQHRYIHNAIVTCIQNNIMQTESDIDKRFVYSFTDKDFNVTENIIRGVSTTNQSQQQQQQQLPYGYRHLIAENCRQFDRHIQPFSGYHFEEEEEEDDDVADNELFYKLGITEYISNDSAYIPILKNSIRSWHNESTESASIQTDTFTSDFIPNMFFVQFLLRWFDTVIGGDFLCLDDNNIHVYIPVFVPTGLFNESILEIDRIMLYQIILCIIQTFKNKIIRFIKHFSKLPDTDNVVELITLFGITLRANFPKLARNVIFEHMCTLYKSFTNDLYDIAPTAMLHGCILYKRIIGRICYHLVLLPRDIIAEKSWFHFIICGLQKVYFHRHTTEEVCTITRTLSGGFAITFKRIHSLAHPHWKTIVALHYIYNETKSEMYWKYICDIKHHSSTNKVVPSLQVICLCTFLSDRDINPTFAEHSVYADLNTRTENVLHRLIYELSILSEFGRGSHLQNVMKVCESWRRRQMLPIIK